MVNFTLSDGILYAKFAEAPENEKLRAVFDLRIQFHFRHQSAQYREHCAAYFNLLTGTVTAGRAQVICRFFLTLVLRINRANAPKLIQYASQEIIEF